uniref:Uncharacterized protein n=1 Tax=Arundo donax TaxID=35708 RepID=A0A0A9CKK1_ARUDO
MQESGRFVLNCII